MGHLSFVIRAVCRVIISLLFTAGFQIQAHEFSLESCDDLLTPAEKVRWRMEEVVAYPASTYASGVENVLVFRMIDENGEDRLIKIQSGPSDVMGNKLGRLLRHFRQMSGAQDVTPLKGFYDATEMEDFLAGHRAYLSPNKGKLNSFIGLSLKISRSAWLSRLHKSPPSFTKSWGSSERARLIQGLKFAQDFLDQNRIFIKEPEIAVEPDGRFHLLNLEDGQINSILKNTDLKSKLKPFRLEDLDAGS